MSGVNSCAAEQFHSDASLRAVSRRALVRTTLKAGSGRRKFVEHDGHIRVRRYVSERCLPQCVIKRQSGLTSEVMDNARPHVASNVQTFLSAQHMQLLPWSAYSLDISRIEHVWDFVGWDLSRDPRPTASKDTFWVCIQTIWHSLPQAEIQHLFDSMPHRIAAYIARCGGYTKY
ncbi:transposable element Tcb2 transposase [Trichonephila clavipes]|uniref:Transposable element Tcb2 transposase n=1 Tax=Trichonephila clavipes TaxID=2585209 RepID=A0A8X6SCH0_TRICX|nr:transposable element Tcb2 transposase [Trichonephila clavipes]